MSQTEGIIPSTGLVISKTEGTRGYNLHGIQKRSHHHEIKGIKKRENIHIHNIKTI